MGFHRSSSILMSSEIRRYMRKESSPEFLAAIRSHSLKVPRQLRRRYSEMKRFLALLIALTTTLSLAACGGSTGNDNNESYASGTNSGNNRENFIIKLGHSDTMENLIHTSLKHFANYVETESKGRLQIELHAAEELGSNTDMAEDIEMGSLDAMMMPQGQEAQYAPKLNVLGMPFLFPDYQSVYKVLDGDIGQELLEGLESHNMIQLAYWENGMRQVTNNTRPINNPADLQGLKIRTPEDEITISIFEALGASPAPLAFSKLYLALDQGTFDGQENPISNIHANNFQKVQKYLAITNHKYECKNMVFSLSTWNKLPEDLQAILMEGAKIYGGEHRSAIVDGVESMMKDLRASGMEITEPDTSVFQQATASVYDNFYAQNGWAKDLVSRIQAEIG